MAIDVVIFFTPDEHASRRSLPPALDGWFESLGAPVVICRHSVEVQELALRGRPRVAVFDARQAAGSALAAVRDIKADAYTGIVPCAVLVDADEAAVREAFHAGADELLSTRMPDYELVARAESMLRRSGRDLLVHPSTRLPGTAEIEAELGRRIAAGESFGACYADLDYFKEYNDRYSFREGDRVIRVVARLLHDVVRGMCGPSGFVGHIGGDDFIFVVPIEMVSETCTEILEVFDELAPLQYSEQDQRAGYYFGKDRRGKLHRVPLMTLSIGVVTTERRHLGRPSQVTALASEMKSYAKTLSGSVFAVDRRQDPSSDDAPGDPPRAVPVHASAAQGGRDEDVEVTRLFGQGKEGVK